MKEFFDVMDEAMKKLSKPKIKSTIFLIVGQNMDHNFNAKGMSPEEVLQFFLTHDCIHDHYIKFYQSDTGEYSPGWGRVVYKLTDGVFEYYRSNVDSSG